MPVEKNSTTIQLLKILSSQSGKRKRGKSRLKAVYPKSVENRYRVKLQSYFKPLIDYVKEFLSRNAVAVLNGDSRTKLDSIPGPSYRRMVKNMEGWIAAYLPDELNPEAVIYSGLKASAEELKDFEDKEFAKQLEKSIGVSIKEQADWWEGMADSWIEMNYMLIKSNARNYIEKISIAVEQAVLNGTTVRDLQKEIQKVTEGLSESKCRLLARDQIGKLQGQITQGQMGELGLEMYVWSTSGDERVRPSHEGMEGLLCRWDDASVYSSDGGKTWIDRPSGAVLLHPGQDIQCRCVALSYFPEIEDLTV